MQRCLVCVLVTLAIRVQGVLQAQFVSVCVRPYLCLLCHVRLVLTLRRMSLQAKYCRMPRRMLSPTGASDEAPGGRSAGSFELEAKARVPLPETPAGRVRRGVRRTTRARATTTLLLRRSDDGGDAAPSKRAGHPPPEPAHPAVTLACVLRRLW